jgi:aminomethyltransferase
MSPSLGVAIGTCYAPTSHTAEGSTLEVEIRGKRAQATVTKFPFYKQATHK